MKRQLLLVAAVLLPLAAATANASLIVLYENDFNTRSSAGPIPVVGGSTVGSYSLAALAPTTQNGVGQDGWVRRHTGTKAVTVVDPTSSGNRYAAFSTDADPVGATFYGHVRQQIGSVVDEGVLRVSVDMLAGDIYAGGTTGAYFYLGGDSLYGYTTGWGATVASRFGFQLVSSTIRFSAFDGDVEKTAGSATVGNWYRYITNVDLDSQEYSVAIYNMGASQPGLGDATSSNPVATFNNLAFGASAEPVSALGMAAFRNNAVIGFDNFVIGKHSVSPYALQVISTQPAIYWTLDEPTGSTKAVDYSAHSAPYDGSYIGNYTQANPGPRPSDGLLGMDSGNLAAGVVSKLGSGSPGAVQYTSLNTTAGVDTDAYTVQMWFKSTVDAWADCRLQYLLARSDGNTLRDYIYIAGNTGAVGTPSAEAGRLRFSDSASLNWGDQVLAPNEWYHLTLVRDGSDGGEGLVRVYLNGELEIEHVGDWQGGTGNTLTIGHRPDLYAHLSGGLGLHGLFDEVAVWNRALSAAEVRANYVAGVPEPSTWLLLALGVLSLAARRRRKNHLRYVSTC